KAEYDRARAEAARSELRARYGLRELEPEESELKIGPAPRGIYAFVAGVGFGTPVMTLRRGPSRGQFEVQKRSDGSLWLVGFVGHDVAAQLRREPAPRGMRFTVYSDAWRKADQIVEVPLEEIPFLARTRSFKADDRYLEALDLELSGDRQ